MLYVTWNNHSERPILRCNYCTGWVKAHADALAGWPDCDQSDRACVIVHQGCKSLFERDHQEKFVWMTVEGFFWQLVDEINLLNKALLAVRSKPRKKKRRKGYQNNR